MKKLKNEKMLSSLFSYYVLIVLCSDFWSPELFIPRLGGSLGNGIPTVMPLICSVAAFPAILMKPSHER